MDQAEQLRSIVSQVKSDEKQMKIITITSGKGGVGKSNFVVNTAIALQHLGRKPVILDADFGLANIEIILGESPKRNLSHMINQQLGIEQIINRSRYKVPFISGGSGVKEMLFLTPAQLHYIGEELKKLHDIGDILLIDTGAGINEIILKFGAIADEMYIIVTPEPTSITDAYALIKTLVKDFNQHATFKVVINKAYTKQEAEQVFHKINAVSQNFLGVTLHYVGFVPYDEQVFQAVKKQVPIVVQNSRAKASMAYSQIARHMGEVESVNRTPNYQWIQRFKRIFEEKK